MAGWKNRGTNRSTWDDGDLDTESAEPMTAQKSKAKKISGIDDKGNVKQGWFNATIAKIPSHRPGKNKKSPVGSTSPSPTSLRTPPRMAGASASPGPSRRGSEAFGVLDSAPFSMSGTTDHGRRSCIMDRNQSMNPRDGGSTPSDMSAALEELKRDVKGLHEAFNSLHKEHTELRGELRMRGGVYSGGLPVESINGGKGLDYRVSGRPTAGRSPFGSEHDAAAPEAAAPLPGEGTSFFGGLLKTCGLEDILPVAGGSTMLKDAAPTDETAKSTPLRSSRGMPQPSFNRSGTNGFNRSGTIDLSTPAPAEGGGSALRGVSPHDREPPMAIRSNLRRPPGVSPSGEQTSSPAFGSASSLAPSPRPHGGMTSSQSEAAPRSASKVPHFGTEAPGQSGRVKVSYLEPPGQRPDSPGRQGNGMSAISETHSDAGSTAGSTASKATWRSPQAGEPLVLPFPDAGGSDSEDDTIGKPPLPPPAASMDITSAQTSRF